MDSKCDGSPVMRAARAGPNRGYFSGLPPCLRNSRSERSADVPLGSLGLGANLLVAGRADAAAQRGHLGAHHAALLWLALHKRGA